jgi:hypothetical protein
MTWGDVSKGVHSLVLSLKSYLLVSIAVCCSGGCRPKTKKSIDDIRIEHFLNVIYQMFSGFAFLQSQRRVRDSKSHSPKGGSQ